MFNVTPRKVNNPKYVRSKILFIRLFLIGLLSLTVLAAIPSTRSKARSAMSLVMAIADGHRIRTSELGDLTNIVFLHHSTGEHFITQGGLREALEAEGFQLWDHGYNYQGLTGPDGKPRKYSYRIPADNTDPDGLAVLFNQPSSTIPINAFSGLLQHEVILIKSCFTPTSHIDSEEQLERYKADYLAIRDVINQHPNKVFLLMTQPPLNLAETNPDEAARARALADWLVSPEFGNGHNNLYVFNTFAFLVDDNPDSIRYNMLRESFSNGSDSHPNQKANEQIVPMLVAFIKISIQSYQGATLGIGS